MRWLVIIGVLGFAACGWQGPSELTDEIEGTYVFHYPSGEVEVLSISLDSTFLKKIYLDKESFTNETDPRYISSGDWFWSSSKKRIKFRDWQVYCKHRNPDEILPEPHLATMMDVPWYGPSSEHNGLISVFTDKGYVFEKEPK
jgi:hypothetical protein